MFRTKSVAKSGAKSREIIMNRLGSNSVKRPWYIYKKEVKSYPYQKIHENVFKVIDRTLFDEVREGINKVYGHIERLRSDFKP